MRGQASFIIIIAILFVIAIVIYYASQSFAPPQVIGDEEKLVRGMVEGIITSGTEFTLKAMELQGGHLIPPGESVAFTNIGVPYWQYCQNDISPTISEVKGRFEKGITYYVNNHTKEITDFFGKNLTLGNVSRIDINILDNRIDADVYMPTRFRGYVLSQPYRVSVPTRFKHLFDFAKDTITQVKKDPSQGGRFFETFTIASLYKSRHLPTIGFLTNCGESIRLSSSEISQGLDEIITYTITHLVWWQQMPSSMTYAVEYVNGKQYLDVSPMLFLPQGFKVTSTSSVNIQNKDWISTFPFPIPYCTTAYDIKYSVGYPVIITVNDPETGYDFNFAVYVNVGEMEPANCDVIITPTPVTDPCSDTSCSATMRIVDCIGNAIEGARAYFGDCLVGESDSNGYISGKVRCGTYKLDIYHSGAYDYYSELVSSSSIDGTYALCKRPEMTVYFNEFGIADWGYDQYSEYQSCYPCASPSDCPNPFTFERTDCSDPVPVSDKCVWMTLSSTKTEDSYVIHNSDPENVPEECSDVDYAKNPPAECSVCRLGSVDVDYIPAGDYNVVVELRNPSDYKFIGYFELNNFRIYESTKKLTVNIPRFGVMTHIVESWQEDCVSSKMNACSMKPLVAA